MRTIVILVLIVSGIQSVQGQDVLKFRATSVAFYSNDKWGESKSSKDLIVISSTKIIIYSKEMDEKEFDIVSRRDNEGDDKVGDSSCFACIDYNGNKVDLCFYFDSNGKAEALMIVYSLDKMCLYAISKS